MLYLKEFKLNEASVDFFKSIHGPHDKKDLIKVLNFVGTDTRFPTDEDIENLVKETGIDPDYLFYDKKGITTQYVYWKNYIYYGFTVNLSKDMMDKFQDIERLKYIIEKMTSALKEKSFSKVYAILDKKVIIDTFVKKYKEIPEDQVYDVFIDVYTRSEFGFDKFKKPLLNYIFSKKELSSTWKTDMEELFSKKLETDEKGNIKLYHGGSHNLATTISWTVSYKKALWFANRYETAGVVHTMYFPKEAILAYIGNRGEDEVLVLR